MDTEPEFDTAAPYRRVRAVRFAIVPVLMVDDGETLTEATVNQGQPVVVPGTQIAEWATETWPAMLAEMEAHLNKPEEA